MSPQGLPESSEGTFTRKSGTLQKPKYTCTDCMSSSAWDPTFPIKAANKLCRSTDRNADPHKRHKNCGKGTQKAPKGTPRAPPNHPKCTPKATNSRSYSAHAAYERELEPNRCPKAAQSNKKAPKRHPNQRKTNGKTNGKTKGKSMKPLDTHPTTPKLSDLPTQPPKN